MRIQYAVRRTWQKWWMTGMDGERVSVSGESVLSTRFDDDNDIVKRMKKKLDGNYTRILRAILNKSWRQQPTKQQLYDHLLPITKTIKVRWTRHAGHFWRSRDELISDVLLRTHPHGRAKAGRLARTYIQQLCEDTGCSPEDLPEAMNDWEKWWEGVRDIHASGMTRWDDDYYMCVWVSMCSEMWR